MTSYFNHGTGLLVSVIPALGTLASGGLVTITLPKNAHDVAFVSLIGADGVQVAQGASAWTATFYPQTVSNGDITEGYVVFKALSAINPGAKVSALVVL